MFAFAKNASGEWLYFEFGAPLDPDLPLETRVRWIMADFDSRRDELIGLSVSQTVALLLGWLEEAAGAPFRLMTLIRALGFLRSASSAPFLEPYLAHPSSEVRVETILALGRIGNLKSLPKLEPFLDSTDIELRRAAIVALSKSLNRAEFQKLDASAGTNPELQDLVRQGKRRLEAVEAKDLRAFTNAVLETEEFEDLMPTVEVTRDFIIENLRNRQRDAIVRRRALSLVSTVRMRGGDRAVAEILTEEADSRELCAQAAVAAGRCKAKLAIEPLIAMVKREGSPLREIAIRSLGQIGLPLALGALLDSWNAAGAQRETIRLAIRRVCKVPGTPTLTDLLRANADWRPEALYFISADLQLSEHYSAGMLDAELAGTDTQARLDAILLMAFAGESWEADKLTPLGTDPDPATRELAGLAAAKMRNAQ